MSSNTNGPESRVRGAKNLPWNLRIGTLNVRTLAQSGSLKSLKMDLKNYKLDVLGVQETGLEEQEIDLGDHKLFLTDSWLSTAKARQGGVGIAVTKRLDGSLIEQVAVSERMAYVTFAAQKRANLVVIVCYAPTNEADDLAKDNFWNQLSSLVSSFKQRRESALSETSMRNLVNNQMLTCLAEAPLEWARRMITQKNCCPFVSLITGWLVEPGFDTG